MKKYIFISLFLISNLFSENVNFREENKSVINIELLGHGLLYSINYDYSICKHYGLGVGFSVVGLHYGTSFATLPIYNNIYFGGNKSSFILELGATPTRTTFLFLTDFRIIPFIGIGYEYRKKFVFRPKIMFFYAANHIFPTVGLTFGIAF